VPLKKSLSSVHIPSSGLQLSRFEPYIKKQIQEAYLFLKVHLVIVHCLFANVSRVPIKISESLLGEYTLCSLAMKFAY
jgi:hypothetical protein